MKINFISNKLFFLSLILALIVGCSEGSKKSDGPVVGITDLSPGVDVNSTVSITEGDDGTLIAAVGFIAATDGVVNYTTYDIDAVAKSDYLPQTGQYEMVADQAYEIGIEILSDTRIEADEKIGVLITDASGKELGRLIATILNDDFPNYTVTASDITEGHVGTQFLEFTIELSENTIAPFPLKVSTVNIEQTGVALAGTDYTAIDSEITFVNSETSKKVKVEVFGDRDIEPNETIELKVEHVGQSESLLKGIIRSDDTPGNGAPTFKLNEGRSLKVSENSNETVFSMPFVIDEFGGFTQDFVVSYKLKALAADVTVVGVDKAEENQDFSTESGQITVLAGSDNLTKEYQANFTIADDELLENIEVLEMELYNQAGVVFGSGRIYITDNESPEFSIFKKYTDDSGVEQTSTELTYLEDSDFLGRHEFYVELAGQTGYDYEFEMILRYPTSNEVASPIDKDDVGGITSDKIISKFIKIEKGNSVSSDENDHIIKFSVEADTLVEANEGMILELRNLNGGTLGKIIPITILNDDLPRIRWTNTDASDLTPFTANEEEIIDLVLQLDNTDTSNAPSVFGSKALENFNITVERVVTPGSETKACDVLKHSNLSEEELSITTEGAQVFSEGVNSVPVVFNFVDDTDVECNEIVDIKVTLKSQNDGVNRYLAQLLPAMEERSALITLTANNTDEASLTVSGFSVNENTGTASFNLSLDQSIELDADFIVTSNGVENANQDGTIKFNSASMDLDTASVFEFTNSQSAHNVTIEINDDDIVELDESYILTVVMDDSYPVKLVSDSEVILKTCDDITGLGCKNTGDKAYTTSVEGVIKSEDRTSLVFNTLNTQELEANLATSAAFTVTTTHEIASDVPTITYLLTNACDVGATVCENPASLKGDVVDNNIGADDFTISNLVIHQNKAADQANTAVSQFDLPISIKSDNSVEPNETIKVDATLYGFGAINDSNPNSVIHYVDSIESQALELLITNDDKLTPSFVGNASTVKEDSTGTGNAAVGITWDKAIADNVPALTVAIAADCLTNGCSVDDSDFIFPNTNFEFFDGSGASLPTTDHSSNIGLRIETENLIEPNEDIVLTMSLPTQNTAYFETVTNNVYTYTIQNDDFITPYFVAANSNKVEGAKNVKSSGDVAIAWTGTIAGNVPSLTVSVAADCDNSNTDLCAVVGDYELETVYEIFDGDSQKIQPTNDSEIIGFDLIGDNIVEPFEEVKLTLSVPALPDVTSIYFDGVGNKSTHIFTLNNDDYIKPHFSAASADYTEKDESDGSASAGVQISWTEGVAANVGALSLNLISTCDADECTLAGSAGADVSYGASKDVTLSVTDLASKTKTLDLTVAGDDLVEPDETLKLTLNSNSGYFKSNDSTQKTFALTIKNNDTVKPYFVGPPDVDSGFIETSADEGSSDNNVDRAINIAWDENIAANLKEPLSINLNAVCTECTVTSGSAINPDLSFVSGDNAVVIHTGTGNATSSNAAFSIGLTVDQDKRVEPDEIIALTMNGGTTDFIENGINTKRKHTIKNDDFIDVSVTSPIKKEGTYPGNSTYSNAEITLSWTQTVDSNVPPLSAAVAAVCDGTVTNSMCSLTGTYADIGNVVNLIDIPDDEGSSVLSIPVKQDNYIEVDEVIHVNFTPSESIKAFFKNNSIPTSSLTIQDYSDSSGDNIEVTLTEGSDTPVAESVGAISSISWDEQRIESHEKFIFSATLSGNQSVKPEDVLFEKGGATNCEQVDSVLTCSIVLGANRMLQAETNKLLMSVVDDSVVELKESLILTATNVTGGVPVLGSIATYLVENNDFVSISLKNNKREVSEGGALEIKVSLCDSCTSISDEAKNSEFSIKKANIAIGEIGFEPVPAADLSSDITSVAYSNKLANFSGTNTFKDSILANIKQDSLREKNEWFSVYITQDELCSGKVCFGSDIVTEAGASKINDINYTSLNDEGFIVIVNDEYESSPDTGVTTCLDITGGVSQAIGTSCGSTSLQDVETHHEEGGYTFVNTSGNPVKSASDGSDPALADYQCIQDNYNGSLWDLTTFNTSSTFSSITIASEYCGNSNGGASGPSWQLPTVADLINIIDFNDFVVDGTNRFKNWSSYWTREACIDDLTKYWVVDMGTGKTMCEPVTETHHAYAVYY